MADSEALRRRAPVGGSGMPVRASQKSRYQNSLYLWGLLGLGLLSGCLAPAQPESPNAVPPAVAPAVASAAQQEGPSASADPGQWTVVPSLRGSSPEPRDDTVMPQRETGWVAAMQAPVNMPGAHPPPLRQDTRVRAPMMRQSLNDAPARNPPRGAHTQVASAPPTSIIPAIRRAASDDDQTLSQALSQTQWRAAPPAHP